MYPTNRNTPETVMFAYTYNNLPISNILRMLVSNKYLVRFKSGTKNYRVPM